MKVVVIGNGIMANMGALYLNKNFPELEILVIGPSDRGGMPVVGESIIESTSHFLEEELGLLNHLKEQHVPKFGLTYYFKLNPEDSADRTYSVHCNERSPADLRTVDGYETAPPSWLLNRDRFDNHMMKLAHEAVSYRDDKVRDVVTDKGGHKIVLESGDELTCDWVLDCSGRRQLLGRKFGLIEQAPIKKNCFWFHVDGIDRNLIYELQALGPKPAAAGQPYHHERYSTTHHFMGMNYWVWMIPLTDGSSNDRMSIGFSWLPDDLNVDVKDVNGFLTHMDKTHPVIADLVRSGTVADTNSFRSFQYLSSQVYSPDRWAMIGDAAFSPDALFSNGLAFGCIQLEQVGEMIRRDLMGELSDEYINTLSEAFLMPVRSTQNAISAWYKEMGDPLISSLRLTWIEVSWFYMLLPMMHNKYHYKEEGLPLWKTILDRPADTTFDLPPELTKARAALEDIKPEHFIYIGKEKVNLRALEKVDSFKGIQEQIVAGGKLLQQYTKDVLERIGS